MEVILEIIFEFAFEIVGEGLLNLYRVFLPNKSISPTAQKVIKAIHVTISVVLFVLLLVGILLLIESGGTSVLGWVFVSLYALYIVIAIIACILLPAPL